MSNVSVIGLGAMGSAIARAELEAGHSVTVWNRTPKKAGPLLEDGASSSDSFRDAVRASDHIIACVDCYATLDRLLDDAAVVQILERKTFIQFSTGTPGEARSSEAWLSERGASYLDGTLLFYPSAIGDRESTILIGGVRSVYDDSLKYLKPLGGDLRYLGDSISAAAAVDLAALSTSVALYLGVAHGARICEAEGVEVKHLASVLHHGGKAKEMAEIIHTNSYELGSLYDGGSLSVWNDVLMRILSHAEEAKINSELPAFLSRIYQRGVDAGYGAEDRAALFKVLSGPG